MYNLDTMRIHGELKVRVCAGGLVRGGTSPGSCWSPSLCVAGRESPGELAARLNQLPTHHRRCGARGSAGRQESLGGLGVAGIVVAATARSGEWCTTVDGHVNVDDDSLLVETGWGRSRRIKNLGWCVPICVSVSAPTAGLILALPGGVRTNPAHAWRATVLVALLGARMDVRSSNPSGGDESGGDEHKHSMSASQAVIAAASDSGTVARHNASTVHADGSSSHDDTDGTAVHGRLVTIFGYGSLMREWSALRTFKHVYNYRVALLRGWTRVFSLVSLSAFRNKYADEETGEMAAVALRRWPSMSGIGDEEGKQGAGTGSRGCCEASTCCGEWGYELGVVGTIFEVDESEIPAYKLREHRYEYATAPVVVIDPNAKDYGDTVEGGFVNQRCHKHRYRVAHHRVHVWQPCCASSLTMTTTVASLRPKRSTNASWGRCHTAGPCGISPVRYRLGATCGSVPTQLPCCPGKRTFRSCTALGCATATPASGTT